MKKILSIVLVVALVVAMAIPAIAADAETGSKTDLDITTGKDFATKDVTIKSIDANDKPLDPEDPNQTDPSVPAKVYAVDVTFDDLTFTYKYDELDATKITWDPEELCYVTIEGGSKVDLASEDGDWQDPNPQNITIKNRSNAKVYYKAGFAGGLTATKNGVTATLAITGTGSLESAEGATSATLPTGTYTVTVSGKPTTLKTFVVDQVKVTLSKTAFSA